MVRYLQKVRKLADCCLILLRSASRATFSPQEGELTSNRVSPLYLCIFLAFTSRPLLYAHSCSFVQTLDSCTS